MIIKAELKKLVKCTDKILSKSEKNKKKNLSVNKWFKAYKKNTSKA